MTENTTDKQLKKYKATLTVNVEVYVDPEYHENEDMVEEVIVSTIDLGQREANCYGVEEIWFDFSKCSFNFHK